MAEPNKSSICPVCREPALRRGEIEPLLPSQHCEKCGGQWIRGEQYFRWREHPDRAQPAATSSVGQVHDSTRAMLCPDCGRILARFRVGHGLDFSINHCGGCGGIWLDANEWESLRSSGLTDRIHFIFSAAWQAQNLRDEQRRAAERLLVERIGPSDFEQLKRFTTWVESHPHHSEVAAFLLEHLRAVPPPKKPHPTPTL